eukprot:TRINITY_DN13460_c0_g1_i2.p1 TRINITY_DN13460_c0_g1~~TRINITY_DN13460_c0_g1_i2.p1  ORF type:complete len:458 (+),score=138.95 TRINITY_DN13460_c0_g1_i2:361-1734(+)
MAADLVVHFGDSCLTPTSRLPVYHMFGSAPIDVEGACATICAALQDCGTPLLLLTDNCYTHAAEQLGDALRQCLSGVEIGSVSPYYDPKAPELTEAPEGCTVTTGWRYALGDVVIGEWTVVFVGAQTAALSNFMLTQQAKAFHRFDPVDCSFQQETPHTNQTLMQRFHFIERAKRVSFFGILVGTLGSSCYMEIINRLKEMISASGRKAKVFLVGKINVPKLANFPEVDAFVLVGCPLSTLMDSKEYMTPILTPFEVEAALSEECAWDGGYSTDFKEILKQSLDLERLHPAPSGLGPRETKGLLELATEPEPDQPSEVSKNGRLIEASKLPQGLLSRSFQGLLVGLSDTAPAKIEPGQFGIARGYSTDESGRFAAREAGCLGESEKPAVKKAGARKVHVEAAPAEEGEIRRAPPSKPVVVRAAKVVEEEEDSDSSEMEMSMDAFAELEDALDNLEDE